jgi:hypothetical protein
VIQKFQRDVGFVIEINANKESDEVYSEIKSHLNKLGYEDK